MVFHEVRQFASLLWKNKKIFSMHLRN